MKKTHQSRSSKIALIFQNSLSLSMNLTDNIN